MKFAPLPGFPEFAINQQIVMQKVISHIKIIYDKFGYVPLETRLIEELDTLVSKGIDSKELFTLGRMSRGSMLEQRAKPYVLRFDQTVPLARYIAQNHKTLQFPFKRSQTQQVYRAETTKVAKGRYNEFYQCDVDVIGRNKLDLLYDCEFIAIIYEVVLSVFNINNFLIRINNRKLLEGLFFEYGVTDVSKIKRAIKVIDDIDKKDRQSIYQELDTIGLNEENTQKLFDLFTLIFSMKPIDAILHLRSLDFKNSLLLEGLGEMELVVNNTLPAALNYAKIDLRIARGLDYYTGTVYETVLLDHPEIGSICSGGRFSELVGTLAGNTQLNFPGCGISFGISRIIPILIEFNYLASNKMTTADILVTTQDRSCMAQYQNICSVLRDNGFKVDIYLNQIKFGKQLTYASKQGFNYCIIANKAELDTGRVIVRNMNTSSQKEVAIVNLQEYFSCQYVILDINKDNLFKNKEYFNSAIKLFIAIFSAPPYGEKFDYSETEKDLLDFVNFGTCTVLLNFDNVVIGFCCSINIQKSHLSKETLVKLKEYISCKDEYFAELGIAKSFRGKGYGRMLMERLVNSCSEHKNLILRTGAVDNDKVIHFYERNGWDKIPILEEVSHQRVDGTVVKDKRLYMKYVKSPFLLPMPKLRRSRASPYFPHSPCFSASTEEQAFPPSSIPLRYTERTQSDGSSSA